MEDQAWTNRLYYGDNLDVMRENIASDSVDLIYLDPPFNSNRNYNVLFGKHRSSNGDTAQIQAFGDTWTWTPVTDQQSPTQRRRRGLRLPSPRQTHRCLGAV